ncbi:MAG: hypothetical protein K2G63_05530 [Oscillospiraceae bacterium]|nr:hypothetical protein [Oscillospiraceae bacterium]
MSYYGEKGGLSFRDNFCEEINIVEISEIAELGELLGSVFKSIAIGTDEFSRISEIHTLAGGMSRSGADVFIVNDVMPVFKYGIRSLECECGVYIAGEKKLRILFFDEYGIEMAEKGIVKIFSEKISENLSKNIQSDLSEKRGTVSQVSHIREVYINSLENMIKENFSHNAVISCGNRRLSEIWRNFFHTDKSDLIFQVSEDGGRVNCYSTDFGFVSYERLVLACSAMRWQNGKKVILPKNFHYAGENLAEKMKADFEYLNERNHREAFEEKFISDALCLCIELMNTGRSIPDIMKNLPEFYTAKREIVTDFSMRDSEKTLFSPEGRINLSKTGKNRITLTVQSMSMETASELCGKWERLILEKNKKC